MRLMKSPPDGQNRGSLSLKVRHFTGSEVRPLHWKALIVEQEKNWVCWEESAIYYISYSSPCSLTRTPEAKASDIYISKKKKKKQRCLFSFAPRNQTWKREKDDDFSTWLIMQNLRKGWAGQNPEERLQKDGFADSTLLAPAIPLLTQRLLPTRAIISKCNCLTIFPHWGNSSDYRH